MVSILEKVKKIGFPIVFLITDLSNVGGYFHIRALKFGIVVHMTVLKSPGLPSRCLPCTNVTCKLSDIVERTNQKKSPSGPLVMGGVVMGQ